jgi:AcrR family transcriptional regulator
MGELRERDRDATNTRLIRAVEELIAEDGFGAVGINAVARRAGADKVLIYRYFGELAGLLAAYAEEGDFWWQVDDLLTEPLPGPADEEGLPACLATVFARHAAFLRDHPVTLEVIAWEMSERVQHHPPGELLIDRLLGIAWQADGVRDLDKVHVGGPPAAQKTNSWYSGWGSSWATRARPMAMISATIPSMRSVDLSLAGFRLPAGSWATATLAAIQRVTGLPPCASL